MKSRIDEIRKHPNQETTERKNTMRFCLRIILVLPCPRPLPLLAILYSTVYSHVWSAYSAARNMWTDVGNI